MSRAEDVWTKLALESLAAVPIGARDQIEALVADICTRPFEAGVVDPAVQDLLGRARVSIQGQATVYFQVVDDDLVKIVRVHWRG